MDSNEGHAGLKVLYTNCDQYVNKRDDLCMLIAGSEPDIILLNEVIPKAQALPLSVALLSIPGYEMYLNFDPNASGLGSGGIRGIGIFLNCSLRAREIYFQGSAFREHLWVELPLEGSDSLLIGCLYRSPSSSQQNAEELNETLRHACSLNHSHLLMVGDLNMPQIDWSTSYSTAPEDHFSHTFIQTSQDCFLQQHVSQPTRLRQGNIPSTLDLVFSNEEGMVQNLQSLPPLGSSDHVVLTFNFVCYTPRPDQAIVRPNLYKADFVQMRHLIAETVWDDAGHGSLEESYESFTTTLNELISSCIPPSKPKPHRKNLYINQEAIRLKKKKRMLWHRYSHSHDVLAHARYVRCRNDLRRLTRNLRRQFEQSLADNIRENVKGFWRYVNSRMKSRSRVDALLDNGALVCDDEGKATVLNNFFSSVFTIEDVVNIPVSDHVFAGPVLEDVDVSADIVAVKLAKLKPCSAPGPDGLHPRILRELAEPLSVHLSRIFRRSLDCGQLPAEWKVGDVVPIFKKGDKQCAGNYRPVSLTCVMCKVMEAIIRDALMSHMSVTGQFHDAQHGFRPKRSCSSQLLVALEEWSRAVENGDPIDVIYCDFAKAFDSVPHKRLLRKLQAYGVEGRLLRWIESFLTNRCQRVVLNGVKSSWASVLSGVPQGSVLGPLLFVMFVNDMPDVVQSSILIFADDTKIYRPVRQASGVQSLQSDIDALVRWSAQWQLPFNTSKCKSLHIGSGNVRHVYDMNGAVLAQTAVEKDLGVQIDDCLKFREQAAAAVAKGFQILSVIRRSFLTLDSTTLPLLFKTLVRPHLEFGNVIWGPYNRADQQQVERVQRRATKLVPELRSLPYTARLRVLGLPSLYYRRRRGDMIAVYQLVHSGIDLDPSFFFAPSDVRFTRGHPWKLAKPRAVTRVRRQAFSIRVINDWNGLPMGVVEASSINVFKARLDAHWAFIQCDVHPNDR